MGVPVSSRQSLPGIYGFGVRLASKVEDLKKDAGLTGDGTH